MEGGNGMKVLASILLVAALSGCLDWPTEAEALRQKHGRAVAEAAATNRFETIPPLEAGR